MASRFDGHNRFGKQLAAALQADKGVAKLRTLILRLAVQGRLSDSTMTRHGDGLPDGWTRTTLGACADILDARRQPVNEAERDLRTTGKAPTKLYPYYGATRQQGWIDEFLFDEELVLLGEDGVPFFDPDRSKAYVISGRSWVNNHAHVLRGRGVLNRFLCHALNVADYSERATGTTRLKLTQGKMIDIPIAVPPLDEQERIVAKVDQLMALCDELEAKQAKKRDVGDRLTKAALAALTSAETPEEFKVAWRRIEQNFSWVVRGRGNAALVRDAILDLGVRGRLSERQAGDTPVASLMTDIGNRPVPVRRRNSSGTNEEPISQLFEAPPHWGWVRLDQVTDIVGGVTKGRDLRGRKVASLPYLRVANVQRGALDLEQMKTIEIPVEEIEKYRLKVDDVLFIEGGDWDKVGRAALWAGEIEPCLHQNHVFRARVIEAGVEPAWIAAVANSSGGRRYFEKASKQTTNLASINMTQLRALAIPLPSPEEQLRILEVVSKLTSICAELEERFVRQEAAAGKLASALAQA